MSDQTRAYVLEWVEHCRGDREQAARAIALLIHCSRKQARELVAEAMGES